MNFILQPRDIQVLKFVYACRAVTISQIARRHFPKSSPQAVRRRLKILAQAGLIRTDVIELNQKIVKVVQSQAKMWDLIKDKWPFEIDNPLFKTESLEHDVRLTELFLRMEQLSSFKCFWTENLLSSSKALASNSKLESMVKLNSDGILFLSDPMGQDRYYSVELEISKKSPERYTKKLINYYLTQDLSGVLYILSDPELYRLIAKVDSSVSLDREPLVYFVNEKDALSPSASIIFKNRKNQILEFK